MARKPGESSAASNSLRQAIKRDSDVVKGILSSDRFCMGIFELRGDDFVFVTPNSLIADFLGTSVEELAGRKAGDLSLPAELIRKSVALMKECREKKQTASREFRMTFRGRETWHEFSLSYIEGSDDLFFCIGTDITERKQAEKALRKSEGFLNNVFDSIQDGISVLDRDLTIVRVNHIMEEWYPHAVPLEGKKCFSVYHGRLTPCEDCPSRRAIENKAAHCGIVAYHGERGEIKGWQEICAFPLLDDHGVAGVIEHVRDITERKRAEEALLESRENFRAAFEQAAVGMTQVSKDGRFMRVNQKFCDITGYTREELVTLSAADITYPPDIPEENRLIKRLLAGEIATFSREKRYAKKDGTIVWVKLTVTPIIYNRTLEYLMGVTEDITDRKRADEALHESERTKIVLMDGIPESMMLLDRNGIILDANCVLARMLHKSKKELIGTYAYDNIDLETASSRKSKIDEVFRTGQPARFEDERAGTCFENIVNPVLSKDGKVEKVTIIAIDITDRKHNEAALRDAKLQAELYLDLLGHDINNMHQIALGYLELAREKHPEPRHQDFLDKPIEALQRSARLIQNVRKLQKLRDDALGSCLVDVARVLANVHREYGGLAGKAVTLDLNGHEQCPVHANELLYDVFANLVGNAIDHTGDGTSIGIVLEMEGENGGRYCRVSVEDNGPGIPDDFKGKVFNRMLKGTTRAKGMGLGLYLVKSLVESYGGRVWVEDRVPGDHTQGAKFVVMLPVASS